MPENKNEIVLEIRKDHYFIKSRQNEIMQKKYEIQRNGRANV